MGASCLEPGDFVRLVLSLNQCLIEANWLYSRFERFIGARLLVTPFAGGNKSGLFETSCSVLPRDRLLSLGGGTGLRLLELMDRGRTGSFSIGGGGNGEFGESSVMSSGSRGSSGRIS